MLFIVKFQLKMANGSRGPVIEVPPAPTVPDQAAGGGDGAGYVFCAR